MTAIVSKSEIEKLRAIMLKFERVMLLYSNPEQVKLREERESLKRDLYYVYIKIGNTQKLAWKCRKTGKCYKVGNNREKTFIEYKNYTFIRDCRMMDL